MGKIIISFVLSIFFLAEVNCTEIQDYSKQKTTISKEARGALVQKFTTLGCKPTAVEEILASTLVEENPLCSSDSAITIPMSVETQVQAPVPTVVSDRHSLMGSALYLVLKEPIRLIQFLIKTAHLKAESNEIPVGFMVATITRFIGATASDFCIGISIMNDFFNEPFLNGTAGWVCGGIFIAAECLHYGGRTVVRSMYDRVSHLYGENGVNYSDTARSDL